MSEARGTRTDAGLLTVDQAGALVRAAVTEHCSAAKTALIPLRQAIGLVLAEPIQSDADCPPFDKSLVDGYALRMADVTQLPAILEIIEEITAGDVPSREVGEGHAVRIMTGAPLPRGTEAVVMVEETAIVSDEPARVRIQAKRISAGQNILRQARCYAAGQLLIDAGKRLHAADIGLLAEAGRSQVLVRPRPRVAILSTGNELVAVDEQPGPGQIRNSNGAMLEALVESAGGTPESLGVARDNPADLEAAIRRGLNADIFLLSGGVSAGVLDLVPRTLQQLGVRQIFHKISLKPGKPLWFGCRTNANAPTLVFGLPGNPVSSLVCFELFVRPTIAQWMGLEFDPLCRTAALSADFQHRGDRPTFFPGYLETHASGSVVRMLRWQGSADLRTCAEANCLVSFAAGDADYPAGASVSLILLRAGTA